MFTVMLAGLVAVLPLSTSGHCDTMDGPVVSAAKLALAKGDITPVLKWVKKEQEAELRTAFQKTLVVRKQSTAARELADLYFFETAVRLHRASEGEPYTGLKPAGTPVEPGIAAADKAVASGKADDLLKGLDAKEAAEVRQRFQRVMETRKHAEDSVEAGREFVAAYVQFIHQVGHEGASGEVEQELQKLEQQWAEAAKRRDVETINRLQSDDFEFTGPSGEIWPKARALEFIKAGNLEITSFELSEFKVRLHGDFAVVNFRVLWKGSANGNDISGPQRMTDVFVKHDGHWQCVASQTTPIQAL